jgi:hypothetical protein
MGFDNWQINAQFKGQGQIGHNQGGMHQNTQEKQEDKFFESLKQAAPPEALPIIQDLEAAVEEVASASEIDKPGIIERATGYIKLLEPYAPMILNGAVAFGSGYFRKYVDQSPVIAGIVDMLDAIEGQ